MGMFEEARDVLAGLARANEELQRELGRKCDWDDPSDVAEHRADSRAKDRLAILDRLVKDRICPNCGRGPLTDSQQWAVNYKKMMAVCRSCVGKTKTLPSEADLKSLFGPVVKRYPLDGSVLLKLREGIGLTQREFARRAGWSAPFQCQLEIGEYHTVTEECATAIYQVLSEAINGRKY